MLFYITFTGGAPQAVPRTACVEANRTACIEDTCSSEGSLHPNMMHPSLGLLLLFLVGWF
jgi:hypothetical protein